jgi:hypothetical protein
MPAAWVSALQTSMLNTATPASVRRMVVGFLVDASMVPVGVCHSGALQRVAATRRDFAQGARRVDASSGAVA